MNIENLENELKQKIDKDDNLKEVLDIVKSNSSGKILMVGGTVFRNIINILYSQKKEEIFDFDFIVENICESNKMIIPKGWNLTKTHHGDPRFLKDKKQVDMWPLNKAVNLTDKDKIESMDKNDKLESYFRRVPLTVQAIAYDIKENKIIGNIGMQAISNKEIKVNNISECLGFCKARRISVRRFISSKSESLNFKPYYYTFDDDNKKKETKDFYETYANEYKKDDLEYEPFISKNLLEEANFFIEHLSGKNVLDLGSGPGRDSLLLKERGLNPICIDISKKMIEICKKKGLEAYQKDMENLDLEDGSFNGIWAYTSLLHIPKERVYNVLARIKELLKFEGLLFIGMIEGNGEVIYKNKNQSEKDRFFSLYESDEFRDILKSYFEILLFKRVENKNRKGDYITFVCRNSKV